MSRYSVLYTEQSQAFTMCTGKDACAADQAKPQSSTPALPCKAVPRQSLPSAAAKGADASAAIQRYTTDQLKIATALFAIVTTSRQQDPDNETPLRRALEDRLPDTKPFFALIPPSRDFQSGADYWEGNWEMLREGLLKGAQRPVLDALARLAKLCILSGHAPMEFFQKELAGWVDLGEILRMQKPAKRALTGSKPADSAAGIAAGVSMNWQPDMLAMISHDRMRPDLAQLVDFMRAKLSRGHGKAWQKYKRLYDAILPGEPIHFLQARCVRATAGVPCISCLV